MRKDRIVPFDPLVAETLRRYMIDLPETQRFLFMNQSGSRFTTPALSEIGRKCLREIGLRGSVQVFRHTFAANWLRNGGSILALAMILGHETLNKTTRYVSLSPKDLVRAMQAARPVEIIFEGMEPSSED